jgi:hypothetical protein
MDFDEDLKKLVTLDNKVIAKVRVEAEEVAAECEKSQRLICQSLSAIATVCGDSEHRFAMFGRALSMIEANGAIIACLRINR